MPVDLSRTYWSSGSSFVGETDYAKLCVPGAFAFCTNGLVKLTPENQLQWRHIFLIRRNVQQEKEKEDKEEKWRVEYI